MGEIATILGTSKEAIREYDKRIAEIWKKKTVAEIKAIGRSTGKTTIIGRLLK